MRSRSPRRQPIDTAPRDGTVVRLWIATEPTPVIAHWSRQMAGWLRDDDPQRKVLHNIVGWAPHTGDPAQPATIPRRD
ncbi:MAG TPA: hypothetical protein VJ779_18695 [Acetobacteraceae bacterium]|nr:hypothetical protein [Acetobacteraceae bacterium]